MSCEVRIFVVITSTRNKGDADSGDILGRLKFGAMLYLEAYSDRWAITTILMYMKLAQDVTTDTLINSGNVVMK